jgi:hypothetical protein
MGVYIPEEDVNEARRVYGKLETASESWLGSDGKMVSWKYEDDQSGMYYRNLVLVKETENGIETYRVFE